MLFQRGDPVVRHDAILVDEKQDSSPCHCNAAIAGGARREPGGRQDARHFRKLLADNLAAAVARTVDDDDLRTTPLRGPLHRCQAGSDRGGAVVGRDDDGDVDGLVRSGDACCRRWEWRHGVQLMHASRKTAAQQERAIHSPQGATGGRWFSRIVRTNRAAPSGFSSAAAVRRQKSWICWWRRISVCRATVVSASRLGRGTVEVRVTFRSQGNWTAATQSRILRKCKPSART